MLFLLISEFLFHNVKASPRLRFNKDGSMLAVTTTDNGIKILANSEGLRLLRAVENRAFVESSRTGGEPGASKVQCSMIIHMKIHCCTSYIMYVVVSFLLSLLWLVGLIEVPNFGALCW